ncbi:helix-turn-helix domain-containing protein [Antrihabitans sp. NCIMB 15449]|uniref:Helix-turn-helix domain-containing protein n=1 Tax=Antrihabitans spumae TaxID=3373370 RepID=A0ABW7JHY0_9NOCA
MTIERVVGVVLTDDDAHTLVDALAVFRSVLRGQGSKPTAKLESLYSRLISAVRVSETHAGASISANHGVVGAVFEHGVIDTATAADILGCTESNVRDLARRGKLAARLVGGRWLLDTRAVFDRAAAR